MLQLRALLLKNIEVGGQFECMGMDFQEMDRLKEDNRYALGFQDYLYPVKDYKMETVAKCLIWKQSI